MNMTPVLALFTISGYPVSLFTMVLAFLWLVYLWDSYLSHRQRTKVRETTILPHELDGIMDQESFQKSRLYSLDKSKFALIKELYHMIEWTAFLYFSVIPWLWYKVLDHSVILNDGILHFFNVDLGFGPDSEIRCSLLYFLYFSLFSFVDSLPWSIYGTFVLEERHGFNKQTLGFFIKDHIKSLVISLVIGAPIMAGLIWIIQIGGQYFYMYAFAFMLCISLFLMFVYPEFIAPLFDRYEPLVEGELRQKIEALASQINFPLKKLLVVEGSKRSAHSNAYFYGFGKNKRIVLYDTLIKGYKLPDKNKKDTESEPELLSKSDDANVRGCALNEEVVAVLAHELGHWKLNHTIIYLTISLSNLFLMFFVFGLLMNNDIIFQSFGFYQGTPIFLRLAIIFEFVFSPYNKVLGFLTTVLSRKLEFQADRFAVSLNYGAFLKTALITLQKDNLSFPVCDWLYSMFNYSHPPLLERLEAIDMAVSKRS